VYCLNLVEWNLTQTENLACLEKRVKIRSLFKKKRISCQKSKFHSKKSENLPLLNKSEIRVFSLLFQDRLNFHYLRMRFHSTRFREYYVVIMCQWHVYKSHWTNKTDNFRTSLSSVYNKILRYKNLSYKPQVIRNRRLFSSHSTVMVTFLRLDLKFNPLKSYCRCRFKRVQAHRTKYSANTVYQLWTRKWYEARFGKCERAERERGPGVLSANEMDVLDVRVSRDHSINAAASWQWLTHPGTQRDMTCATGRAPPMGRPYCYPTYVPAKHP